MRHEYATCGRRPDASRRQLALVLLGAAAWLTQAALLTGCGATGRNVYSEAIRVEAGYLAAPPPEGAAAGRIQVEGVGLHYIDYGGLGQPLVFLSGLGNSAHVWDEFAPRFTDSFHVYALTRRGYGESDQPKEGYDTERLTDDVVAMMDSLGIDEAILVGHSVAGDELSCLGERYPERAAGLIYLDAAYDRSHTTSRLLVSMFANQLPPSPPRANDEHRASVADYQEYLEQVYGVRWPASEVRATRFFEAGGRYVRDVTPWRLNLKVMRGESSPRYTAIEAPVLAIYSVDRGIERDYPWTRSMSIGRGVVEVKARRANAAEKAWERGERRRLARALPSARIVEIPHASHYLFLSHPDQVEAEIRGFADRLSKPEVDVSYSIPCGSPKMKLSITATSAEGPSAGPSADVP